ncbi:MAG: phosphoribosylglycinamide formyltransferase [Bacteroidota bacterium]
MKNIAIFASGNGSNALKIIEFFKKHPSIQVGLIVSNNADAGVLSMAKQHHIPTSIINKKNIIDSSYILSLLDSYSIDFIALAGFMILIPAYLSAAFTKKMVNIHPALLPKYGGKGMYGHHVHEAVFANKEKESGITIHYVNEQYDEGQIVFQKSTSIEHCKSAEEIAMTVLRLEHENYAPVIEKLLQ